MIIYINNELCSSLEQLRDYFKQPVDYMSVTFSDLVDYGRNGNLASWIREIGDEALANEIAQIDRQLTDTALYLQMRNILLEEQDREEINGQIEPDLKDCYCLEDVTYEWTDDGIKVSCKVKILYLINEIVELKVQTGWGTRSKDIKLTDYYQGQRADFVFDFRKRPYIEPGEMRIFCNGLQLKNLLLGGTSIRFSIKNVAFQMICIKKGSYMMGATSDQKDENCWSYESAHKVVFSSDYYIGETPVTQGLWEAVMGTYPSYFGKREGSFLDKWQFLPVEQVSWEDCMNFIMQLNKMTGRSFRLPTEAEWECAARGGDQSNRYQCAGRDKWDLKEAAWFEENSGGETHPVAECEPNELGLFDMSGNVNEWCSDKEDSGKVFRGGSWDDKKANCRVSSRNSFKPTTKKNTIGFRLVLTDNNI